MSTANIKLTIDYTDGEKQYLSLGPIAVSAINEQKIRSQINILNNPEQREIDYEGFTTGLVSTGGANFASISGAQIIVSKRTVIF